MQTKITPEEIRTRVDVDYFGLRDEDDGLLLKYELIKSREEIEKVLKGASEAGKFKLFAHYLPTIYQITSYQVTILHYLK